MSVFLNNVDDFIVPSQACVNPLVLQKTSSTGSPAVTIQSNPPAGAVGTTSTVKVGGKNILSIDHTQSEFESIAREVKPDLIKTSTSSSSSGAKVATVSLNDCLACRYGCIVSHKMVLYLNSFVIVLLIGFVQRMCHVSGGCVDKPAELRQVVRSSDGVENCRGELLPPESGISRGSDAHAC